jgi:hypothetical protein
VQKKKGFKFFLDLSQQYVALTTKADSLFLKHNYIEAVNLYEDAFAGNYGLGKVIHRYKAASCNALLGKNDRAFEQLNIIATKGKFSNYDIISNDVSFIRLQNDSRWKPLLEIIDKNRKEHR